MNAIRHSVYVDGMVILLEGGWGGGGGGLHAEFKLVSTFALKGAGHTKT